MDVPIIIPNFHKLKGIVVDTNLLLLLFLGLFDTDQIGKHKTLRKFTIDDLERLQLIVNRFQGKLFVTTNILTEICNHCNNFNEGREYIFLEYLKNVLTSYREKTISILEVIGSNYQAFLKFGLTDATIADLAKDDILVLTDDFPLYHYLSGLGHAAINFTHLQYFQ